MTTQNTTTDNEPGEALEPPKVEPCAHCSAPAKVVRTPNRQHWAALVIHKEKCIWLDWIGDGTQVILERGFEAWNSRAPLAAVEGDARDEAEFDAWWDEYQRPYLPNGVGGYTHAKAAWMAARAAASSPLPAELPPNVDGQWKQRLLDGRTWELVDEALQPEGEQERLRHPRLTSADYERIQGTLDSLPNCPTEEEAEAVLQACGTSGKEVVNGFIERLLRERSEMQAELNKLRGTPPAAPVVAREAAEEIAHQFNLEKPGWVTVGRITIDRETETEKFKRTTETATDRIAAIITRHLAGTADAPETVELQIARRFLVKMGYARCASAACGCNSWHERRP